jgi:multidrug resistance efflux pump
VAVAAARVDEAGVGITKAKQALGRQRELYEQKVNDVRDLENAEDEVAAADAERAAAAAELQTARLDLAFTKVVAPVNGYVTNLTTSPGTYAPEGAELLALVDKDSFWVAAYFKETQLGHVRAGGRAKIIFMGHESAPVAGEIESVGWGVFREDGSKAADLLPRVSQTVDWVRLPQRFPARVRIVGEPPVPLRIGQTTSVVVVGD